MITPETPAARLVLLAGALSLGLAACDGGAAVSERAGGDARTPPGMPASAREPAPEAAPPPRAERAPAENAAATPANAPVVTVLGDSITAGYGLSANQALPVQLEAALRDLGVSARVRGAGVSGDTTAGGLARVDFSVRDDTDVAVVALGGNDLLQGVSTDQVRRNLDQIITRLKGRGMTVVLAGMRAPPQFGAYAAEFDALYADLARKHDVAFYPFLLDGVALVQRYNQSDGIHPNAEGARLIAARMAPTVARAVQSEAG
jgi:acyl-CoA thioesterase I